MKIKWSADVDLNVTISYDEEADQAEDTNILIYAGEEDEIDVISDREDAMDMQFGDGAVALGVSKTAFEVVEA
jgi:hypothetical protein